MLISNLLIDIPSEHNFSILGIFPGIENRRGAPDILPRIIRVEYDRLEPCRDSDGNSDIRNTRRVARKTSYNRRGEPYFIKDTLGNNPIGVRRNISHEGESDIIPVHRYCAGREVGVVAGGRQRGNEQRGRENSEQCSESSPTQT
jgi:hypothetical protein